MSWFRPEQCLVRGPSQSSGTGARDWAAGLERVTVQRDWSAMSATPWHASSDFHMPLGNSIADNYTDPAIGPPNGTLPTRWPWECLPDLRVVHLSMSVIQYSYRQYKILLYTYNTTTYYYYLWIIHILNIVSGLFYVKMYLLINIYKN